MEFISGVVKCFWFLRMIVEYLFFFVNIKLFLLERDEGKIIYDIREI